MFDFQEETEAGGGFAGFTFGGCVGSGRNSLHKACVKFTKIIHKYLILLETEKIVIKNKNIFVLATFLIEGCFETGRYL